MEREGNEKGEENGWGRKWRKRIKRVMGAGGTKERMRGGEEKETVTCRNQTRRERHEGQRGFIWWHLLSCGDWGRSRMYIAVIFTYLLKEKSLEKGSPLRVTWESRFRRLPGLCALPIFFIFKTVNSTARWPLYFSIKINTEIYTLKDLKKKKMKKDYELDSCKT